MSAVGGAVAVDRRHGYGPVDPGNGRVSDSPKFVPVTSPIWKDSTRPDPDGSGAVTHVPVPVSVDVRPGTDSTPLKVA